MADQPASISSDISTAAAIFPDAKSVFAVTLKPLDQLKDKCIVVLDTNVLLVPYTINPKGLGEVEKAYDALLKQKRLVIPGQVAREFAKNRPNKLSELHHQLSEKRNRLQAYQKGKYPLLESLAEYGKVVELEQQMHALAAEYRTALSKVLDHVRNWTWNDPVSLLYARLFTPDVVIEASISKDDLKTDIERRVLHKIPPGYKDAAKDDSGAGDIIIWHTILELGKTQKKDIIFVSADGKPDWFHQSDGPLYPRFELVDEFRRISDSGSFHILKFSEFLDLFGAVGDVVEEVRQEEAKLSPPSETELRAAWHGFGLVAERAVGLWLSTRYPNRIIEPQRTSPRESGLDYVMIAEDGTKIGVDVRSARNPLAWKRRIIEMTERGIRRGLSEVDEMMSVLVTESERDATLLARHLPDFAPSEPIEMPVTICVGSIDAAGLFNEVARVSF
jgi:hypothetical protein